MSRTRIRPLWPHSFHLFCPQDQLCLLPPHHHRHHHHHQSYFHLLHLLHYHPLLLGLNRHWSQNHHHSPQSQTCPVPGRPQVPRLHLTQLFPPSSQPEPELSFSPTFLTMSRSTQALGKPKWIS